MTVARRNAFSSMTFAAVTCLPERRDSDPSTKATAAADYPPHRRAKLELELDKMAHQWWGGLVTSQRYYA
jgi:hypothetical protein